MNSDEFYNFEDRAYLSPTVSSGEQNAFIDNLRNVQQQNTAEISQQTQDLGTDVPSNLGGLGGGEAYFTSRYQTPQVNEMVSTLKSAAQAEALNEVMNNYKGQLQNKYKQAYRAYQKRERNKRKAAERAALQPAPSTPKKAPGGIDYEDPAVKPDKSPTITSVPISGHDTTSYPVGSDYVTYDKTTGEYYINGVNVGTNPSKRSIGSSMSGVISSESGGGGGGSW
jgi:hypothetical protein